MDDSGSARRAAFLSDGWWRRNPIVAAVLTVAVAAAVLQRTRAGGAPQAQCRAGACSALQAQVEAHVALVHGELQEMVTSLCPTDPALGVPSPWEQQREEAGQERNVNVPSCDKLRETGLEAYYGNLNMLLVEAWLAKILPALRRPLQRGKILQVPSAELITLQADGLLGGAIFVQQLRLPTGAAAPAAMMLGIHRLPRHKAMRQMLGRAPLARRRSCRRGHRRARRQGQGVVPGAADRAARRLPVQRAQRSTAGPRLRTGREGRPGLPLWRHARRG